MDNKKLELAQKMSVKIECLKKDIKVFKGATSDSFAAREGLINILGNTQEHGFACFPASAFKMICQAALLACQQELSSLELEFEAL